MGVVGIFTRLKLVGAGLRGGGRSEDLDRCPGLGSAGNWYFGTGFAATLATFARKSGAPSVTVGTASSAGKYEVINF